MSGYLEEEQEELRQEGVTLLSVKGDQTASIDQQEAWRIADAR